MKEVEIFIGPCSKYITGQGWTTEAPVEQLKAKGWVKSEEIERLTERETFLENAWKTSLESTQTVEIALKASRAREEELQKQVDELRAENGRLHKIIVEEMVSMKAVRAAKSCPTAMKMLAESVGCVQKDTAKEIYSAVLEFCPVHNDGSYTKFIEIFEDWLKHKYGVEVE